MNQKQSNFKQLPRQCNSIDDLATTKFRTVEELLEARSGASFYLQPWCIRGMPAFSDYPNKSL